MEVWKTEKYYILTYEMTWYWTNHCWVFIGLDKVHDPLSFNNKVKMLFNK